MMSDKKIGYQRILIGLLSLSSQVALASSQLANHSSLNDSTPIVEILDENTQPATTAATDRLFTDTPIACTPEALAAAITAANTANNSSGGAVVILPANCTISIQTPASSSDGLPPITGNVTLVGSGSSVISRNTAAAAFRIITVNPGGTLSLRNLSIENGSTAGQGGGVLDNGTLVVQNVSFLHNNAGNGGGFSVSADSTATVFGSLFQANTTTGVGGGGIINFGTLNIFGAKFIANTAPINGGAINTQSAGVTTLHGSQLTYNTSGGLGGALSNLGTLNLFSSKVRLNTGTSGGGIATGNTNVTLVSSVIANNNPDNCSPQNTINGCVN